MRDRIPDAVERFEAELPPPGSPPGSFTRACLPATIPEKDGPPDDPFVYDADGNRLITRTDAAATLNLGGTEVTVATGSSTPHATRYYDLGDGNEAVRNDDNSVYFLLADSQDTGQLEVNSTDLTMQERRTTPFGGTRGTAPSGWSGDKGFVGGTNDPGTGLTHLGARDYDTATGRFLSVDPDLDSSDPQSLNGYAYGGNDPVSNSDPTGLYTCRNGHEGCDEHGNACGSDCSAWATQTGDCVHTECSNSKVNQNPDVSLKKQRQVSYEAHHCSDLCDTLGITTPSDPRYQQLLESVYGQSEEHAIDNSNASLRAQYWNTHFHPRYDYTTSEYIGPNSLGDPQGVMWFFEHHPHDVFPFKVTGCGSFVNGAVCVLHPGDSELHGLGNLAGGPGKVRVSMKTKTSFTFTVIAKGYFDQPGSQITFSISSRKNGLYLTQHGWTTGSSYLGWLGTKLGFAKKTWQQQARNLRSALDQGENIMNPDFGMGD